MKKAAFQKEFESHSAHLRGLAADISIPTDLYRFRFLEAALQSGFLRIGMGKDFIHMDVDTLLPSPRIWVY